MPALPLTHRARPSFSTIRGAHQCGISHGYSAPAWRHWPRCSTACGSKHASPSVANRLSKIISSDACRFPIPYVTYAAPSGCSSVW
ncbi:hypothetical protein XAR_1702 [Xanthomonas citri pv. glycines str. 8ra]|nr:hypothetical protein XAR_1702 [Xanthomonas citri pv. glycines str. 8ra]